MMTTLFPLRLRLRGPRTCATAAVIVVTALTSSASPWENMSTGLFNEAHAEFTKLEKAPGADLRSLRYGDAVSLLNIQPRTQSKATHAPAARTAKATFFTEVPRLEEPGAGGRETRAAQSAG